MRLEIFDPAMCCPTGVCGPGVDPELSRIAKDLEWLKKIGVEVTRYNLSRDMEAFVANTSVSQLLAEVGPGVLPVTIVNGDVKKVKKYPAREEIENWMTE